MAYDERLAERIRVLLDDPPDASERKMFGGLAFLLGGNMAVVVSGQGGIMLRVDPDVADDLVERGTATLAEMRGRPMRGWLRVGSDQLRTARQLARWIDLAETFTRTLPPKG